MEATNPNLKKIQPLTRHTDWAMSLGRTVFALLAIYYVWNIALHAGAWPIIDGANLAIHEAGHFLFSNSSELWRIAGGTILQLTIPLLIMIYFLWRNHHYALFIIMLWLGESLINVHVYVRDAIAMKLPLIGGPGSIHDWNWLLSHFQVLDKTSAISQVIWWLAVAIISFASLGALTSAWQKDGDLNEF